MNAKQIVFPETSYGYGSSHFKTLFTEFYIISGRKRNVSVDQAIVGLLTSYCLPRNHIFNSF